MMKTSFKTIVNVVCSLATAIMLISIVTSCIPEDKSPNSVVEGAITLSTNELKLGANAMDPTPMVTVTTEYTSWEPTSTASWLTATRQANSIIIGTKPNTSDEVREADVLIITGGSVAKVHVTQEGGGAPGAGTPTTLTLDIEPLNIEVPTEGDRYLVRVATEDKEWKVETNKEHTWLVARQFPGFFELTVHPNDQSTERTSQIYVTMGDESKSIEIKQAANLAKDKYGLPFFSIYFDIKSLLKYEVEERGGTMISYKPGGYTVNMNMEITWIPAVLIFSPTQSEVFDELHYEYNKPSDAFRRAWFITNKREELMMDKFLPYLEQQGFKREETEMDDNFNYYAVKKIDDALTIAVQVEIAESEAAPRSYVRFAPIYTQVEDYATYPSFPYEAKETIEKGIKLADVKEIIAKQKGNIVQQRKVSEISAKTFDKEKYGEELYEVTSEVPSSSHADIVNRRYRFDWRYKTATEDLGKVFQVWEYRKDVNKMMWQNPNREWRPTREFSKLLEQEGFEYDMMETLKSKGAGYEYLKKVTYKGESCEFRIFFGVVNDGIGSVDYINNGSRALYVIFYYKKAR